MVASDLSKDTMCPWASDDLRSSEIEHVLEEYGRAVAILVGDAAN
jgi:hypothetical protein